jgi:hypothetical protein
MACEVGQGGAGTHSFEFSNCARTAMMGSWLLVSILLCMRESCRGRIVTVRSGEGEGREGKVGVCFLLRSRSRKKTTGKLFFMI